MLLYRERPVSYTHLDVYKRQAMESLKAENQELKEEAELYIEEIKRLEDLQKQ